MFLSASCVLSLQEFTLFLAYIAHLFSFLGRKECEFKVAIKITAKTNIRYMKQFLASRQMNAPQQTIHSLHIVLLAALSKKIYKKKNEEIQ